MTAIAGNLSEFVRMSDNTDTVLAYVNMKHGALYFSYVIPDMTFLTMKLVFGSIDAKKQGIDYRIVLNQLTPSFNIPVNDILPPRLRNDKTFAKLLIKLPVWEALNAALASMEGDPNLVDDVATHRAELVEATKTMIQVDLLNDNALNLTYAAMMDRYDLDALPVILPRQWLKNEEKETGSESPQNTPDYRVSLVNANLIDVSSASWEQIISFREDKESQQKLKRLRHFFSMNYANKSRSFIEDDLQLRLEDHERAAKKFGFETSMNTVEAVLSSQWLKGTLTGAGIAMFCGQPLTALASGFAGVLFEAGNVRIKLEKRKFEFNQIIESHPLGYVIDAKSAVEKPPTE